MATFKHSHSVVSVMDAIKCVTNEMQKPKPDEARAARCAAAAIEVVKDSDSMEILGDIDKAMGVKHTLDAAEAAATGGDVGELPAGDTPPPALPF
jgi:hypothetical protein